VQVYRGVTRYESPRLTRRSYVYRDRRR
jgi:hypothetical protein